VTLDRGGMATNGDLSSERDLKRRSGNVMGDHAAVANFDLWRWHDVAVNSQVILERKRRVVHRTSICRCERQRE